MTKTQRLSIVALVVLLWLIVPIMPAFSETAPAPQTGDEALIMSFEKLDEWRTWEIRRELHRIHHHLEYMPIMVFTHVGIFLVLLGMFVVQLRLLALRGKDKQNPVS